MWWFVLQNAILSICIILILQYLWEYFKNNYTTRKTKHIVDTQTQKYRDIIKEIHQKPINNTAHDIASTDTPEIDGGLLSTVSTDYISEKDKAQMIKELTQFLHTEI